MNTGPCDHCGEDADELTETVVERVKQYHPYVVLMLCADCARGPESD